jgi:UDP-N-acetylmuramate--alanine ligase
MKIHFIGIKGSGVSGVSALAQKMGYTVSGCDLGIKGHDVKHLKDVDLVVATPAVFYQNNNHPEILEAKKRNILITWQEFLGKILLKEKKVICIAGTHGKSTTTAMAGKLLIDNGFDPIVVVGAKIPEWDGNSHFGKGDYAVVEADEFNNNFLHYHPEVIIINNIEFDHPDFFENEKEVNNSFGKFVDNLVGTKILITEKDSLHKKFNLNIFGEHNQKNANMVYVLGKKLGISDKKIIESIESFKGIGRRMELIADKNGIKVYDDYAHHPTAIKTTLEGLRQKYPNKKILAIIEPHGYKRTKALLPLYKNVFNSVDKVIIGPIFKARDMFDKSISPDLVAKVSRHPNIDTFNNIKNLKFKIKNYDVIIVMGAGHSNIWAKEIANSIPVSFSTLTTFRTGGEIKKYFEVADKEELIKAVKYAKDNKLHIFVLGAGSDIVVSDKKYDGVVIKYTGNNISITKDNVIRVEAGTVWDDLVEFSVQNNLQGMECLSGIPGTVGASPIQNIGAYGQELSETFISLEAYDIEKEKLIIFSKKDCKFGYRESIFKQKKYWQKYIIINVSFKLSKYVDSDLSLQNIRDEILRVRSEKLENPNEIGNAGSFFKNPIVDVNKKTELEKLYSDIVVFPYENEFKISAGWLIEKTGWKGKKYNTAAVSSKHALILINPDGKAYAQDVKELSDKIISDVYKKFGVMLEREVQLINF